MRYTFKRIVGAGNADQFECCVVANGGDVLVSRDFSPSHNSEFNFLHTDPLGIVRVITYLIILAIPTGWNPAVTICSWDAESPAHRSSSSVPLFFSFIRARQT